MGAGAQPACSPVRPSSGSRDTRFLLPTLLRASCSPYAPHFSAPPTHCHEHEPPLQVRKPLQVKRRASGHAARPPRSRHPSAPRPSSPLGRVPAPRAWGPGPPSCCPLGHSAARDRTLNEHGEPGPGPGPWLLITLERFWGVLFEDNSACCSGKHFLNSYCVWHFAGRIYRARHKPSS